MDPSLHKACTFVLQFQSRRLEWQREAEVKHSRGIHRLPAKAFSWQFMSWWVKAGEDYPGMHWELRMHSIGLASWRSLPSVHRSIDAQRVLWTKSWWIRTTGILWVLYNEEKVSVSCNSFKYKYVAQISISVDFFKMKVRVSHSWLQCLNANSKVPER